MLTKPFNKAKKLIETIESYNYEAYFVGGAVRDLLLGEKVNDIDITTSASPEQIQQMFKKVIPIGIEYGTVLVRYDGNSYEVTTYREDGHYSNQRQPDDVTFMRKLDEDLKRRDFTINALAMDKHGDIIDLFNGKNDIKNKLIRAVGQANKRFAEDPLRIIRALRFSSQLGFEIEKETLMSMNNLKDAIENVAVERLTEEITKLFQGKYINHGISYLKETNIYNHLPLIKYHHDLINKLPATLLPLNTFSEVACLFHYVYPELSITDWIKAWKGSKTMQKEANRLFHSLKYYESVKFDGLLVYNLDYHLFAGFCTLTELLFPSKPIRIDKITNKYESLPIKSRRDINFNGNDLLKLFPNQQKGRWISDLIEKIEREIILNGLLNDYTEIREWVLCNPPEVN